MEKWEIKVETNAENAFNTLKNEFEPLRGVSFHSSLESDQGIHFNIRKRILDGEKILYYNNIIVKGCIIKTNDSSVIKLIFKEHALSIALKIIFYLLSAFFIAMSFYINLLLVIPGIILLVFSAYYLFVGRQYFKTYVNEYKNVFNKSFQN